MELKVLRLSKGGSGIEVRGSDLFKVRQGKIYICGIDRL